MFDEEVASAESSSSSLLLFFGGAIQYSCHLHSIHVVVGGARNLGVTQIILCMPYFPLHIWDSNIAAP